MFAWMLWSVACQSNSPELADEAPHILGERRLSLSHNGVVRGLSCMYQQVTTRMYLHQLSSTFMVMVGMPRDKWSGFK